MSGEIIVDDITDRWLKYFQDVFRDEYKPKDEQDREGMFQASLRCFIAGYCCGTRHKDRVKRN